MSSEVKYWHKSKLQNRYILELKIWTIENDKNYPETYKYRLICIDKKTGNKILFDNHSPKGHHFHINNNEFQYKFINEDKLIRDFEKLIFEHFGVKL